MVAVIPDVSGGSKRSLAVVAVVPDVSGGSRRSLAVVAFVSDVPGGAGRWKWSEWFQASQAAAAGR